MKSNLRAFFNIELIQKILLQNKVIDLCESKTKHDQII